MSSVTTSRQSPSPPPPPLPTYPPQKRRALNPNSYARPVPDLLGDFVVLFSWRLSRRPPSRRYPFGLAKFETVGTGLVAVLLIGGGIGIGSHSLSLLLSVLSETASAVSPGPLQTALLNVTAAMHHIPAVGHSHVHAHVNALDLNAAWFAAASVVAKEWLFQITRKVADQENSPVLLANAYHHRSDAYSSVVALIAILGSGWFPALPLDPLGGASRTKRHFFPIADDLDQVSSFLSSSYNKASRYSRVPSGN